MLNPVAAPHEGRRTRATRQLVQAARNAYYDAWDQLFLDRLKADG